MKTHDALLKLLAQSHPETAARGLEGLDGPEGAALLKRLPDAVAIAVVERMVPTKAADVMRHLEPERAAAIFRHLPPRSARSLLLQIEEQARDAALKNLPEEQAKVLRDLLRHAEDTAGAIMETPVASIAIDHTVQEAVSALRKAPRHAVHYLYVTDREGKLAGVVSVRDLLLAAPRDTVESLVQRDVVSVPTSMDQEQIATIVRERGFLALPVVDEGGRLLGVVRHEQVLKAAQEEAFEDMQRLVGAGGDERALSPSTTAVGKRLPWLCLNLGTAFLAALVVGFFEDTIAAATALAVLMPVVSAVGGNTGAQALAVVIRGLALNEVLPGQTRAVLMKEAGAGLLNGACVGLLCAAVVLAWSRAPWLAAVIGAAMVFSMIVAALLGAAIPLALRALGRDPAQSASIFLTTLTDVVGFASFLGLARLATTLVS